MESRSSFSKKRIFLRAGTTILAIIAAVGVFFGVKFLIEKIQKESDIKVGDTVIKYDKITKNAGAIKSALDADKGITFGEGSPEEIARKDLILNALLKSWSKECEPKYGKISYSDMYLELNYGDSKTEADAKVAIEDFKSKKGEFEYVRLENIAYKAKWDGCIIGSKKIFKISYILDTPYFTGLSKDDYKKEALLAKQRLTENFLPLFKEGRSKEEIAAKTDYNTLGKLDNYVDISAIPATFAFVDLWGHEGGESNATLYNESKTTQTGILEETSFNETVKNMKPGEYTKDVLIGKNGEVAILRVESASGKYNTWGEFYEKESKKHKVSKLKYDNKALAAGVNNRSWQSCGPAGNQLFRHTHYVTAIFTFKLRGSTGSVAGHKVQSRQGYGVFSGNGMQSCGINYDSTSDNRGQAEISMNCLAVLPHQAGRPSFNQYGEAEITFIPARGYRYVSTHKTGGGVSPGPRPSVSHYVFEGGLQVFKGANQTSTTHIDVIIEKDIVPPPDREDNVSGAISSKTSIKSDRSNRSFRTGDIVARVGENVHFKHEVFGYANSEISNFSLNWNTSNDAIHSRNKSRNINLGRSANSRASDILVLQGSGFTGQKNHVTDYAYNVTNSVLGRRVCERISANLSLDRYYYHGVVRNDRQAHDRVLRSRDASFRTTSSTPACFYVPYDYELTPCVSGGKSQCGGTDIPGEPGEIVEVVPKIKNNNRGTDSHPDTRWKITTWRVGGRNESIATPNTEVRDENGTDSCQIYSRQFSGTTFDCRKKEGKGQYRAGTTTVITRENISIPADAEIGSRYCVAISVSPYRLNSDQDASLQNIKVGKQWRHSAPICILVTKKPKMQIWGNGIYARGGIDTSRSSYAGKGNFGSWVEYEAIAGKIIKGFTSEASNGSSITNNLTFRNGSGNKGEWGEWRGASDSSVIVSNINSRFSETNRNKGVLVENNITNYAGWNGDSSSNRGIHTHIVKVPKNAIISGNILSKNPSNLNSLGVKSFQQTIMIVEGDLYIHKDVTNIDAWLIVKGKIVTCADTLGEKTNIVTESNCGKQLRINGPVISDSLKSWRTGRSDYSDPNVPSEIYNQRADVYLWAYSQGTGNGKIVTTYTKELPIRY